MGDLKSRLNNARAKLLRRGSATSTSARSTASSAGSSDGRRKESSLRKSVSLTKLPEVSTADVSGEASPAERLSQSAVLPPKTADPFGTASDHRAESSSSGDRHPEVHVQEQHHDAAADAPTAVVCPAVTLEAPTPIPLPPRPELEQVAETATESADLPSELPPASPSRATTSKPSPPGVLRRQSLVTTSNARDAAAGEAAGLGPPTATDYFSNSAALAGMLHRKIWVKRPNASATLVQIREDDLVDDVRDMILKKYANSLGRNFDAPDVTLRIFPRDTTAKSGDRMLGPEEDMCRTLDAYYPGGQSVNEALLIDVPKPRTPKPSPRVPVYYSHHDDTRPFEAQSEYFPPMPIVNPSPTALTANSHESRMSLQHASHSIAVLQTGQLPPLPSPGSTRRLQHHGRPKYPRHNTASPTTLAGAPSSSSASRPSNRPRHDSSASETKHSASSNAALPTPPAPTEQVIRQNSTPPTPRIASPRPDKRRKKVKAVEPPSLPSGLLDGSVPPINVLIVEDNIINLRVLGAFMQRLKVRWQRAMNGKEAVEKWRAGGFHLVLMDIQLPIMNGLEATKEIRRLERVNGIGVFSSGSSKAPNNKLDGGANHDKDVKEGDRLGDNNLFKSPVIIVALTASSLQSDRHEALAAGCNDFLTKPVNFVWLERKVKEWGCMQALIDFDGWRRWKDFAAQSDTTEGTSKLSTSYSAIAPKGRTNSTLSPTSANHATNGRSGPTTANGVSPAKAREDEKKHKRRSTGQIPPSLPEEESSHSTPEADSSNS
ncbi:hypothetical protein BCR34DRAFT_624040 [Clohesyomyces aquaticus]|uniref:Response regulatory domain-containing protein n=1 Tax=Clohesyomyces aquaticus TaxID=1231657 RepID=A0A1Y1ZRT9_9PLEO|nr:hypothetical protein BCR34DRAFT_624040 [Clohesyomyces aquaticus]